MKNQSESNVFKVGVLGAVSGLSIFLIFSWLPFSNYISGSIMGLIFSLVLLLPYHDGIELTSIKTIATEPKSIIIMIISITIAIIITVVLVRLVSWRGLIGLEIFTGANLAGILLGLLTFIIFNLKGRFDFPKWVSVHPKKSTFSDSNLDSYNFMISATFPNKCTYCGENSETTVDMKFERSTNVWAQMFTKGKKLEPVKVPFCTKHANESKINTRILFFSYLVPAIYIIVNYFRHHSRIEFFDILALAIGAHIISTLIQLGVKVTLTPFFQSIKAVPLHFTGYGMIGRLLGLKIKASVSDRSAEYKFANSTISTEFEEVNS